VTQSKPSGSLVTNCNFIPASPLSLGFFNFFFNSCDGGGAAVITFGETTEMVVVLCSECKNGVNGGAVPSPN